MAENTITPAQFAKFLIERKCVKIAPNKDEFFMLKSGRRSPVFVNMGSLIDSQALDILANAYADKIHSLIKSGSLENFDVIFGPAYKGIPLGAITAAALFRRHKIHCKFLYDRKEEKMHGDINADKIIVGADQFELNSKVLIIDDVVSSGKSKFDTAEKLKLLGDHQIVGVIVAVDRQELGGNDRKTTASVADEINSKMQCPLFSIAHMGDIFMAIKPHLAENQVQHLREYFQRFGSPSAHKWAV